MYQFYCDRQRGDGVYENVSQDTWCRHGFETTLDTTVHPPPVQALPLEVAQTVPEVCEACRMRRRQAEEAIERQEMRGGVIALASLQAQDQQGHVPPVLRYLQDRHERAVNEEGQRQERADQAQYRRILQFAGPDAAIQWWQTGRSTE